MIVSASQACRSFDCSVCDTDFFTVPVLQHINLTAAPVAKCVWNAYKWHTQVSNWCFAGFSSFSACESESRAVFSQLSKQQMTQEMSWYSIHEKKNTLCRGEQRSSHPSADPLAG